MIGFIVTGVGLPLLVVSAIALVKNGANELGSRVHPWFGAVFTLLIYLSIGPFFGVPRNANVAFEMGFNPLMAGSSFSQSLLLLGFTALFFFFVFLLSLYPSKVVDLMGKVITPTLLISIVTLFLIGFSGWINHLKHRMKPIKRHRFSKESLMDMRRWMH